MTDHKQSLSVTSQGGTLSIEAEYNSVLPPPSIIREYDALIPGAAREILDMAKSQMAHRHSMEIAQQAQLAKDAARSARVQLIGQISAITIILSVLCSAAFLLISGRNIEGLAALLIPLAAVAGVVVLKK